MEKRKSLAFLFCLLMCYSLFQRTARAQSSSQVSMISQGRITDPRSNVNLAVAPDDWGDGPYKVTRTLLYGCDGRTQIWSMDNTVLYNGNPSMRCGPNTDNANSWRELDLWANYLAVKPGDHVVFTAWIKQASSTKGTPDGTVILGNAAIWFDVWDDTHFIHTITGQNSFVHPEAPERYDTGNFAKIGDGWTQVNIDIVMPATVKDVWGSGQQIAYTHLIAMLSGGWGIAVQEQAVAWFVDTELYINPT